MDILALCRKMVILFFCMATGFAAAKGGAMDLQSNKKLSALVVNIANPMQILASALTGEHLLSNGETLRLAGLIVLIYLGLIALSFPAAKVLRVKGSEAGLYRFMFIFSNTGFLGYPIVESLLGYQATFYVTLFVLFFQLFCWSYGASLIRGEARFRFQWQVLRQPCVAASLAALAIYLSGWQPPALLHQAVKYVGDITRPIVMLIVGCALAQMTNLPAYAMAARPAGLTARRFDLILADSGSFILVVMLSDSSVKNKLIRLPVELTEQDLKLLGAVLNASVTELTADQLTPELLSRVTRSAGNAASLVPVIMDFVTTLLHQERSEVYMTGQARLLGQPEYHDIDKAQKMLTTLDEDVVSNLPAALSSDSRTQILVGPENVSKELKDTSVVMTKFDIGDGMQGLIGVVGPTRMDYAQITARLSYFAENLSRMFQKNQTPALEEPDNKHHDPEA